MNSFFFFQNHFEYSSFFASPYTFQKGLVYNYKKKFWGGFDENYVKSVDQFGES